MVAAAYSMLALVMASVHHGSSHHTGAWHGHWHIVALHAAHAVIVGHACAQYRHICACRARFLVCAGHAPHVPPCARIRACAVPLMRHMCRTVCPPIVPTC